MAIGAVPPGAGCVQLTHRSRSLSPITSPAALGQCGRVPIPKGGERSEKRVFLSFRNTIPLWGPFSFLCHVSETDTTGERKERMSYSQKPGRKLPGAVTSLWRYSVKVDGWRAADESCLQQTGGFVGGRAYALDRTSPAAGCEALKLPKESGKACSTFGRHS